MKKYILGAILSFSILSYPAFANAAGLTPQQATTLIQVVQASPGTPASAFVSLITAFSDLNVNQASSLITVVQSSPGTAASIFVPLITSFTDNSSATQSNQQTTNITNTSSTNTSSTLSVDLKINGSDGPLVLADNQRITLSWTSNGASCYITNIRPTSGASNQIISGLSPSGSREVYSALSDENNGVIVLQCRTADYVQSRTDEVRTSLSTTVATPVSVPSITITASSGGQSSSAALTVGQGSQINISGNPLNLTGLNYSTDYTRAYIFDPIFNNSCGNNTASESIWTMTCNANNTGTGRIYIEIYRNGQVYRSNVMTITVVTPSSTASPTTITVISPNGGETWNRGQTYSVSWNRNNMPVSDSQVLIRLRASDTGQEYNLTTTTNDGAHSVTVPTTIPVGAYKLEIKTGVWGYMDASDSYFKVVDPTIVSAPDITVNGASGGFSPSYTVTFGGTVAFNWSVSPTSDTTCYAAGTGLGGTTGNEAAALSGNWTTPPLYTNITYGMKCVNSAGTTYKYVRVAVDAQTNTTTAGNAAPVITVNNSSSSSQLNYSVDFGGTVAFVWSVTQPAGTVTSCYAAGTGLGGTSGYEATALSGSWTTPKLYTNTTYGIKCSSTNAAGVTSGTTHKYANVTVATQISTATPAPTASARCSAQTITWSGDGNGCSGLISETGSGSYSNVNNTVAGKRGNARFDCSNGSWVKDDQNSVCANYCSADGALASPATLREKDGARSSCQSPGYSWQTPSWVGSGPLPAGFCAYGSYNYANDTLAVLGGQCYNCSVGSWVPIASSYCKTSGPVSLISQSSQTASALNALGSAVSSSASGDSTSFSYKWSRDLQVGSSYIEDIRALQTALALQGLYFGEITGGFYNQTFTAVKAFQQKYGIEQTGFVGPATRAKLNALY
jgi:hypothetical protein